MFLRKSEEDLGKNKKVRNKVRRHFNLTLRQVIQLDLCPVFYSALVNWAAYNAWETEEKDGT